MNINIQALNYFKDQYPSFLRFSGTMGMGDLCVHFLRIDARFSFSKRVTSVPIVSTEETKQNYRFSQSDAPDTPCSMRCQFKLLNFTKYVLTY